MGFLEGSSGQVTGSGCRRLALGAGSHVTLVLVLPGLQGEDESHNLPVE